MCFHRNVCFRADFNNAGCVTVRLTSNTSKAQTAVVATLNKADQAKAPDQGHELSWSHCSGPSCTVTVPTNVNSTYFTGVESNATTRPYNFTLSYTLRPSGDSGVAPPSPPFSRHTQRHTLLSNLPYWFERA
jgi:hypothetical protein